MSLIQDTSFTAVVSPDFAKNNKLIRNGAGGTPRFRLCAPDEKVNMEKMNAVNLEKMYEVLKFVEYGGYCRRSMDCVHGMPLIDRMKNEAVVDKAVLFGWFRKMAVCAEQYERCGEGRNSK